MYALEQPAGWQPYILTEKCERTGERMSLVKRCLFVRYSHFASWVAKLKNAYGIKAFQVESVTTSSSYFCAAAVQFPMTHYSRNSH